DIAVALADTDVVDQNQLVRPDALHDVPQLIGIAYHMNRHAQHLPVDLELFVRTDPVGIGGDEHQLVGPATAHATGGELGNGGGLAHPGGADQGERQARLPQRVFAFENGQV